MPMTTITTNHCTNQHISLARLVALVGEEDLARLFCTESVSSESPENYSLILAPSLQRCILDSLNSCLDFLQIVTRYSRRGAEMWPRCIPEH